MKPHHSHERNYTLGFTSLVLAAITYSVSGVTVRYLGSAFGVYGQVALRGALVSVVAFLIYAFVRKSKGQEIGFRLPGVNKLALGLFLITQPLANLAFVASVMQIKATNTIFYLYVATMTSGFAIGVFVNKEKVTKKNLLAFLLMSTGLVVFSIPLKTALTIGVLLALAGGSVEAIRNAAMGYLQGYNKFLLIAYRYLATAVVAFLALKIFGDKFQTGNLDTAAIVSLAIIVFAAIGTSYFLLWGMQNFDVNLGNMILASEIMFAAVINAIFLKEVPTSNEILGAILMVASLYLIRQRKLEGQIQKN